MADPSEPGSSVTTDPPSPATALQPRSLSQVAEDFMGKSGVITERRAGRLETGATEAEAVAKGIADLAREQEVEREKARPTKPDLTKPPSTAARAFLEPGPSVLGQVQAAMLGIGQIALGWAGAKGPGYAIAATAGLKGAAEGWQAGDAERVKRGLAEWSAARQHLMDGYQIERDQFNDLLTNQKLTMSERFAQARMRAEILGMKDLADAARQEDLVRTFGILKDLDHSQVQHEKAAFDIRKYVAEQRVKSLDPKTMHYLREVMHIDPTWASDEHLSQAHQAVKNEEIEKEKRHLAALKETRLDVKDLQSVTGGPWVPQSGPNKGKIIDRMTWGEWREQGGSANFKPIAKQLVLTFDMLEAEAFTAIAQMQRLGPKILAQSGGANLLNGAKNLALEKISDPDVRAYTQSRRQLTAALGRVMTGGVLRRYALEAIEKAETPFLSEKIGTAANMLEQSRTNIVNLIRVGKGLPPNPLPDVARTVDAINVETGEEVKAKLGPWERLQPPYDYAR